MPFMYGDLHVCGSMFKCFVLMLKCFRFRCSSATKSATGNNYVECATIIIFDDNLFTVQNIWRAFEETKLEINLTDEKFSGLFDLYNFSPRQTESTCFYYITGEYLLLSNGRVFKKYIEL